MNSESQISDSSPKAETPSPFSLFKTQFDQEAEAEKKIRLAIDFMRSSLAQGQIPNFKDFWEARRLCLPLFKENINAKSRSLLWAEYIEISAEARRLKEILDEQSAFAVEQIELAISALEKDLENYDALLQQFPDIDFPEKSETLHKNRPLYRDLQRELNYLNTFASRINGMRKEIIKTEMRIRHKNRFFERLSQAGDKVFPKRKDLIKQISDQFIEDVNYFVNVIFKEQQVPLFVLREEIKILQSFAKVLTLNTQAFSETRLRLSECWDELKEKDKERKKEITAKKQIFKQNFDLAMEKIKVFAENCLAGLDPEEEKKQVDEILDYMRSIELGREEVRALREEISIAREPLIAKQKEEEFKRQELAKEAERQKRAKVDEFKTKITDLIQSIDTFEPEILTQIRTEMDDLSISKVDKQTFERLFKQLKEKMEERREKALLNLSEADLQALSQLKSFLEEKKQERQEVKTTLENFRKTRGGSNLDFEKAMQYQEMIDNEKARLEKINSSIEEIEEKIAEFEGS